MCLRDLSYKPWKVSCVIMYNCKPSAAEVRWGAKTEDSPETHRELA